MVIIIQSWTNQAQKIRLVNFDQTVQLVFIFVYINTSCMGLKIHVTGNLEKFWILGGSKQDLNLAAHT